MKKVLSIGLASMMMLGMFAGCKAPEDDGGSGGAKSQTLTVYALESAYGTNIWNQIARRDRQGHHQQDPRGHPRLRDEIRRLSRRGASGHRTPGCAD